MGEIKRIIKGINRIDLSQCGFCFIDFCHPKIAIACFVNTSGLKLNNRIMRIDLDEGFNEGRQFGRGKRGGQFIQDLEILKRKGKFFKKRL
jgi:nuclear cap-binding protein subunit 2